MVMLRTVPKLNVFPQATARGRVGASRQTMGDATSYDDNGNPVDSSGNPVSTVDIGAVLDTTNSVLASPVGNLLTNALGLTKPVTTVVNKTVNVGTTTPTWVKPALIGGGVLLLFMMFRKK